ncbi:MAG TPA: DUF6599 family protein [Pyrinomonadaceae bacterium]|nr:DUF6599 family protein [Pyrinomonadaceae bacterium]
MRIPFLSKLSFTLSLVVLFCAASVAQTRPGEAAKLLPEQLGAFRAQSAPVRPSKGIFETTPQEDYEVTSDAWRVYTSADGKSFGVHLARASSESAAYSLFTHRAGLTRPSAVRLGEVGTVSASTPKEILFAKGRAFVAVSDVGQGASDPRALTDFARAFAATLEGGESGLPVLVSHLPDWEKTYDRAAYAVTLPALQTAAGRRPVLDAVSLEGGAEAVAADYGGALLVVVEFTTPQHAFDADAAVNQRIAELKAAGQPVPSSYKRVGNYAVFAFDAPDAAAAERLVSGVKWEKDVRWLGHNPRAVEIATRAYTSTMGGVIKTTLIMTGLAILLCLGVGGLIGGAVFLRRRARQAEQEIYTDAGGMVRLNIEDLNTPSPSSKLLKPAQD